MILNLPTHLTVYEIVCNRNRKSYIGVTDKPLPVRLKEHMSCHSPGSKMLVDDVRKYGRRTFFITALFRLPLIKALSMELYVIYCRKLSGRLYNGTDGGEYPVSANSFKYIQMELERLKSECAEIPAKLVPPSTTKRKRRKKKTVAKALTVLSKYGLIVRR